MFKTDCGRVTRVVFMRSCLRGALVYVYVCICSVCVWTVSSLCQSARVCVHALVLAWCIGLCVCVCMLCLCMNCVLTSTVSAGMCSRTRACVVHWVVCMCVYVVFVYELCPHFDSQRGMCARTRACVVHWCVCVCML